MRITREGTIQIELTPKQCRVAAHLLDRGMNDYRANERTDRDVDRQAERKHTLNLGRALRDLLNDSAALAYRDKPAMSDWAMNLPNLLDSIQDLVRQGQPNVTPGMAGSIRKAIETSTLVAKGLEAENAYAALGVLEQLVRRPTDIERNGTG